MKYWLMKTEPSAFSIDDLQRKKVETWDGVRNFQARNFMIEMEEGDGILFYHSSTKPNGVYGLAKVAKKAHPDLSQFDSKGHYFDPKATKEKPIWHCVDVEFVQKFREPVTLEQIKADAKLEGMRVRAIGSRLSVQPVSRDHFDYIVKIAK